MSFQDTNEVQYDLLRLIATGTHRLEAKDAPLDWTNRSLTVVGDVDQSIYSWRGANFRIILGFQEEFKEASLVKLLDNYRSTGTILEMANTLIENNSERLPKELRSVKGKGDKVYCYEAHDDRDEAQFILDKLLHTAKLSGEEARRLLHSLPNQCSEPGDGRTPHGSRDSLCHDRWPEVL